MKKLNKKPVVLITGYLGSGKTTLLNNLLKQESRKVALIVNDMGSINVDAEILKKNGNNITECPMFELQNGCICCTLRDEFIKQIEKISGLDSVEVVFVEASGISDPGAVSASFLAYEEDNPDVKEAWDEEFGDRVNQLVIIGKGYNQKAIREALESCLDQKAIA
ncbi:MAG: GTP-binding protein [Treponema sp.]|nr:GTP-binding protein [Treponema sp.]